jgi:putative transposase
MSKKAYKYPISANKQTTEKLRWVLDRCRELSTAGLQERHDAYEMAVRHHPHCYDEQIRKQLSREHAVGYYEQKRELLDIKELRPEYQEMASHVLQDVILRLKRTEDNFFRRVQNGEQPAYPRFRGRNRYDSFCYPDGAGWKLEATERPAEKKGIVRVNLKLTKIGTVKLHLHRTMQGTIKTLTIKREGEHCYAIFTCEIGKPEPLSTSDEEVGMDLGVTHFAALSNGQFSDHPRSLRHAENQLAKAQQALSRKPLPPNKMKTGNTSPTGRQQKQGETSPSWMPDGARLHRW